MPKYKLKVPKELVKTIKGLGYDVPGYFQTVFLQPLLAKHRETLEAQTIAQAEAQIAEQLAVVEDSTTLEEDKA